LVVDVVFSSGWCFALQAGSIANDSFSAIYILAAVDLALRARETKRVTDLWLSLLAAALVTGTKQSNIPLVALWLAAAWPALRLLRSHDRWPAAGMACLGLLVSIVPVTIANLYYTGTCLPLEFPGIGNFKLDPFWGIIGNAISLPAQNLLPPFYSLLPPFYIHWNGLGAKIRLALLHSPIGGHFSSFENFLLLTHAHGITEENSGIGLGICILLLIAIVEAWRHRDAGGTAAPNRWLWWLRVIPWGLLLIFMATNGSYQNARQLAPYYTFLLPVFLVRPGQVFVARERLWQRLGQAVMALTAVMLITSVDRPLFPVQRLFGWLNAKYPGSAIIMDGYMDYLYSYFRNLEAHRNFLRRNVPPDEPILGYCTTSTGVDEIALWQPLNGRRVVRILPEDPPERLRQQGIHFVVIDELALQEKNESARLWLETHHAQLINVFPPVAQLDLDQGYCQLYLVYLNDPDQ
jgi:hypothetical protein